MKQINRWVIATSTGSGGPWHLGFARELFTVYEDAAKKAFERNKDGEYLHKAVRVAVSPAQQGGIASEAARRGLPPFNVRWVYCGSATWKPVTVEPWDGLFVGSRTVFELDLRGKRIHTLIYNIGSNNSLNLRQVGLVDSLMTAIQGYGEWD